ncbi:MAG: radical SAM protein [bacterium]|nr:radical SAM protein [bacterium]
MNDAATNHEQAITKLDKSKRLGLISNNIREWGLRNDVKRILLYEALDERVVINKIAALAPSDAIIFALFDGKRTTGEVIKTAADLFDETEEKAANTIERLLTGWRQAFEEKGDGSKTVQYDPGDFIIPAAEVDRTANRLYKPINIIFRLSEDCVRKCIYCNIERIPAKDSKPLSLERWEQLAEEVKQLGILSVSLTGGDPFINKNAIDIAGFFTSRGIHPFIATKSLVTEEKAKQLADIGIKAMQVSIDAPNEEVVDFLTASNGAFRQTVTTIKNLSAAGIRVSTNSVVTSYNALLIPELVRFLNKLGVKRMRISQYGRTSHAQHKDEFFLPKETGLWLEKKLLEMSRKENLEIDAGFNYFKDFSTMTPRERKDSFEARALCSGGRWGVAVSSEGYVIPCDEMPTTEEYILGNLKHQSILEVWQSPKNDIYLNPSREPFKGTVCFDCESFEKCHHYKGRCYRDALKAYDSMYAPAPQCGKAPIGKRLS